MCPSASSPRASSSSTDPRIVSLPLDGTSIRILLRILESHASSAPAIPSSLLGMLTHNATHLSNTGFILFVTTAAGGRATTDDDAAAAAIRGDVEDELHPSCVAAAAFVLTAGAYHPYTVYMWCASPLPPSCGQTIVRPLLTSLHTAATSFRGTLDLSTRSDAQRDDEMQLYGLFHLFGTPSGLFEAVSPHVKTTYKSVPYDRWFLPADPPPEAVKYDDAREWTDHHGDRFVMDRMRDGDYEQIIVHATITLAEPYFRHLLSSPVLRKLHRVIRHLTPAASPPGPPISWAMTHGDMSVGLVATTPAFRGRGLARLCVAAVCAAQRAYLAPRTPTQQPCFAYIDPANAASQAMMTRVGFEKEREHTYTWCGVSHVIDDPHGQPHDEIPLPASKPADAA